jgi:hypothetical protein
MFGFVKKAALGTICAVTLVAAASPAEARDRHYRNNDRAAVAVGAGILGLAVGAAIASNNRDRYYYDDRYYYYPPRPRYRAYYYAPPPPPRYYRHDRHWRGDRYYRYRRW